MVVIALSFYFQAQLAGIVVETSHSKEPKESKVSSPASWDSSGNYDDNTYLVLWRFQAQLAGIVVET